MQNGRTYELLEQEIKIETIDLYDRANMRVKKLRLVRNIGWANNSKIANFWSQILIFQIEKIQKFVNFPIWTIPKIWKIQGIGKVKNSKNF